MSDCPKNFNGSIVSSGGEPTPLVEVKGVLPITVSKRIEGDKTIFTVTKEAETPVVVTGPTGPQGPAGPAGPQGPTGPQGPSGVGTAGATGATPDLQIGTVAEGTAAAATITGTALMPKLNLVLQKGNTGATGPAGPQGATGPQGPIGPSGVGGGDLQALSQHVVTAAEGYQFIGTGTGVPATISLWGDYWHNIATSFFKNYGTTTRWYRIYFEVGLSSDDSDPTKHDNVRLLMKINDKDFKGMTVPMVFQHKSKYPEMASMEAFVNLNAGQEIKVEVIATAFGNGLNALRTGCGIIAYAI